MIDRQTIREEKINLKHISYALSLTLKPLHPVVDIDLNLEHNQGSIKYENVSPGEISFKLFILSIFESLKKT